MGHQSYVLLCTETTLSNHPVVHPKSSCDVHLFSGPWISKQLKSVNIYGNKPLLKYFIAQKSHTMKNEVFMLIHFKSLK